MLCYEKGGKEIERDEIIQNPVEQFDPMYAYHFSVPGLKVEAAAKVRMNKTRVSIYKKKTCRLVMRNVKAGTKVTWKTSKSSMASIKAKGTSCTVTGKKDGTAV